jgi:hypothetical protein
MRIFFAEAQKREHGRLDRTGARRGSLIDEVAARVSFTLETSVPPTAHGVDRAVLGRDVLWRCFGGFRREIWVKLEVAPPSALAV